jgi:hypothetical protein
VCAGVWLSLRLGEARVLPLGMWPDYFAHARGGAGAVLGGRRAAGRRAGAAWPRLAPAPPRQLAGADGHPLHWQEPPLASVVGHWGRAATPGAPPALPCAPGDGLRPARPSQPRWPARCPSAKEPTAACGRSGQAGAGGGGLGSLWLAGAGGEGGGRRALLLAGAVCGVRPTPLAVALASPVR